MNTDKLSATEPQPNAIGLAALEIQNLKSQIQMKSKLPNPKREIFRKRSSIRVHLCPSVVSCFGCDFAAPGKSAPSAFICVFRVVCGR
jgi:hypothetical protein